MMIVACCLLLFNQSSFLQIIFQLAEKFIQPFYLVQSGLVLPSFEQDQADGAQEEDVGNLDEQHEEVHVDELGGSKIGWPVLPIVLAKEAPNNAHIWKVRGDLPLRPRLVSNCSDGADK